MADFAVPAWLTTADVERAVRLMPDLHEATITEWTGTPLSGGGECLGIWRVAGLANVAGDQRRWSIVLKGWAGEKTGEPPTAWNWPLREAELYRSGILADLPGGIRAPRCYGDVEREDGSVWLWLEDITDGVQAPWPIARYATVARQLGQFNGAWLVDRPLPDAVFLSRGWLRGWTEASAPAVEAFMAEPDLAKRTGTYTAEILEGFAHLWNHRHDVYDEMDRLPQTFCHLDAFSRNIFIREQPLGADETILIDWSFAGLAPIGGDLMPLIAATVSFMDAPVEMIGELADAALDAYIAGLADAGWHGDTTSFRRILHASMALRYGIAIMRFDLMCLLDPSVIVMIERMTGQPIEKIQPNTLALNTWMVRRLTEDRVAAPLSRPSAS